MPFWYAEYRYDRAFRGAISLAISSANFGALDPSDSLTLNTTHPCTHNSTYSTANCSANAATYLGSVRAPYCRAVAHSKPHTKLITLRPTDDLSESHTNFTTYGDAIQVANNYTNNLDHEVACI